MSRRRRLLALLAAAMTAVAIVVYALSPRLLSFVGSQLIHADPLENVDAMVVLSGGVDRVVEAAELYRRSFAPLIVLTTEIPDPGDEFLRSRGVSIETTVDKSRRVLERLGVDSAAIVTLDEIVGSTADEARVFARWTSDRPIRSVMIVTSPYHTARARLTFLRALADRGVKVIVRPSTLSPFRNDSWWQSRATLRDGIYEWQKLLYYFFAER